MTIPIDWETVLDQIGEDTGTSTREVLPVGTYHVKITKAEATMSTNDNEMIKMTMEVVDGEHKGRWIWDNMNFALKSPKSMEITVKQMGALGITRNWLAANQPSVAQIAKRLIGREAMVKVGHREYNGSTYLDVKSYDTVKTEDPF